MYASKTLRWLERGLFTTAAVTAATTAAIDRRNHRCNRPLQFFSRRRLRIGIGIVHCQDRGKKNKWKKVACHSRHFAGLDGNITSIPGRNATSREQMLPVPVVRAVAINQR